MADFGLFQTPSPDEVMAQDQQQQTAMQAQGPAGQNLAAVLHFAQRLGGNPQLAKAQKLQTALAGAMQPQQGDDGGDDITQQMRRLQRMRDAVIDIDPSIASKLNLNLLKLHDEQLQRQQLLAQTQREQALTAATNQKLEVDKPGLADAANKTIAYVYDQKSGQAQAFDLSKPENAPAFEKAKSQPGAVVMNGQDRLDLLKTQIARQSAMDIARLKIAEHNGLGETSLTPETIHTAALLTLSNPAQQRYYATAKDKAAREAIANERQAIMDKAGINGSDLAQIQAQIAAQKGNAAQLQKSLGVLGGYEAVARNNGQRILDLANKLDLGSIDNVGSIPATTALELAVKKGLIGDADAAEYASVLKTFQFEAARILTAGPTLNGVVSDTARAEMEDVVKGKLPLPAFIRVVNRLLTEMEVRRMGLSNELQQAITGSVAVRENRDGTATAPTFPGTSPQQPSNLADLARQELERRKNGSK